MCQLRGWDVPGYLRRDDIVELRKLRCGHLLCSCGERLLKLRGRLVPIIDRVFKLPELHYGNLFGFSSERLHRL